MGCSCQRFNILVCLTRRHDGHDTPGLALRHAVGAVIAHHDGGAALVGFTPRTGSKSTHTTSPRRISRQHRIGRR